MTESSNQLKGFSLAIAKPLVALLVGAGVSKGFGFSLMGGDDYKELLDKFREDLKKESCDEILDYINLPNSELCNLEDVFEQITLINRSAETLRNCRNGCNIASDAKKAEKRIGPFVAKHYAFPKDRDWVGAFYSQLFDAIWPATDGNNVLPVFTTNYDLALENFCTNSSTYDLVRGFEGAQAKWDTSLLHAVTHSVRPTIALMKLHGSTGWKVGEGDNVVALPLGLKQNHFTQVTEVGEHAIVAPVRKKAPERDPYLTYFAYLEECAANAAGLILLGYAFNEIGVQNAIRMGLARRRGVPLYVLVVDMNPKDVVVKLKEKAPPGTINPTETEYNFGDPQQASFLKKVVSDWAYNLPEFSDLLSAPSNRWNILESPPDMIKATSEGISIEWNSASSVRPGYWQWHRVIEHTEFTVSFEIRPDRFGRGWYPGIQLADETGKNVFSIVMAARKTKVNTHDGHAIASVLGEEGWERLSSWGQGYIIFEKWYQVELEVSGRQCWGIIGEERHKLKDLLHQPRFLRIGCFSKDQKAECESMEPGRCLIRNLNLRRAT